MNDYDPDWIIVQDAQWHHNSNGEPRMDVLIHNFTQKSHTDFETILDLSREEIGLCLSSSPPSYKEIPIEVKFEKEISLLPVEEQAIQGISVLSGDLQSPELIQRNSQTLVKVRNRDCNTHVQLRINLGNIGQLPPEEFLRIRYIFNEIEEPEIKRIFNGRGRIFMTGNKVYPNIIKLSR